VGFLAYLERLKNLSLVNLIFNHKMKLEPNKMTKSKYIYRTYDNSSIDGIKKADREHNRLINLGYRVSHTSSGLMSAHMTYELCS